MSRISINAKGSILATLREVMAKRRGPADGQAMTPRFGFPDAFSRRIRIYASQVS